MSHENPSLTIYRSCTYRRTPPCLLSGAAFAIRINNFPRKARESACNGRKKQRKFLLVSNMRPHACSDRGLSPHVPLQTSCASITRMLLIRPCGGCAVQGPWGKGEPSSASPSPGPRIPLRRDAGCGLPYDTPESATTRNATPGHPTPTTQQCVAPPDFAASQTFPDHGMGLSSGKPATHLSPVPPHPRSRCARHVVADTQQCPGLPISRLRMEKVAHESLVLLHTHYLLPAQESYSRVQPPSSRKAE